MNVAAMTEQELDALDDGAFIATWPGLARSGETEGFSARHYTRYRNLAGPIGKVVRLNGEPHPKADGPDPVVDRLSFWTPPALEDLTRHRPLDWTLEGWMQTGLAGALVAGGSTGKTSLWIHLLCRLAYADHIFGIPIPQNGTGVMLSLDDSQDDLDGALSDYLRATHHSHEELALIRQRVRLISLRGVLSSGFSDGVKPSDLASRLCAGLSGIDDLQLVVLETMRMFSGGDSSDERAMTLCTAAVNLMAQTLERSVALSHHMTKTGWREGVDDMYAGTGSGAIADNLRFLWVLRQADWDECEKEMNMTQSFDRTGDLLKLVPARGSIRVRRPDPIYYIRDGWSFRKVPGKEKSAQDKALDTFGRVAAFLETTEKGASKNQIRAELGGDRTRVYKLLNGWISEGLLVRSGFNVNLTDKGQDKARRQA
jgi:hypothetical protein